MERTALVTGGSWGIGLAIARLLRVEGFALTLASRRPEQVDAAARELGAEDLQTKHWDLQLGVNLRGLFLVKRAALPMLGDSRGLVANLASIAGMIPVPGLAAYGAAKAAVISLTRSWNAELDADGVHCTAICPGFVDTPMAAWTGLDTERMARPEDCAEIVRMLLRLGPAARIPQVVVERVGEDGTGV